MVRDGLRLILESEDDFEVVGEAANGAEAVRLCGELNPQVVLMDLRMPGMDGLTAIKHIRQQQPDTNIVILTTYNEDALMLDGLAVGRAQLLAEGHQAAGAVRYAAGRGPRRIAAVAGRDREGRGSIGWRNNGCAKTAALGEIALTDREQEVLDRRGARRAQQGNRGAVGHHRDER